MTGVLGFLCGKQWQCDEFRTHSYYYVNTSEIPGELSCVDMIYSHVKMTCYSQQCNPTVFWTTVVSRTGYVSLTDFM